MGPHALRMLGCGLPLLFKCSLKGSNVVYVSSSCTAWGHMHCACWVVADFELIASSIWPGIHLLLLLALLLCRRCCNSVVHFGAACDRQRSHQVRGAEFKFSFVCAAPRQCDQQPLLAGCCWQVRIKSAVITE